MKILIATGGFKEGARPQEVADLIAAGLRRANADVEITTLPLADGGTGLVDLLARQDGAEVHVAKVSGPLPPDTVQASYAELSDGTAVIESASAAGLALVDLPDRDPRLTTTRGVGELIVDAYARGLRNFIIGCGDSATNDGGMGCAAALGVRLLDDFEDDVPPIGQHLGDVRSIELTERAAAVADECTIEVACNPNSIPCGPGGTTRVYGPQKGATADAVLEMEEGMERFVALLEDYCGEELKYAPGAGGAGGLAVALHALFGARLRFSFDVVRQRVDLEGHLETADLVITGEGLLDRRTLSGKLPANVALQAKRFGCPVAVIAGGTIDKLSLVYLSGFDAVELSTARPCTLDEALGNVNEWLPAAAERLLRKIAIGRTMA